MRSQCIRNGEDAKMRYENSVAPNARGQEQRLDGSDSVTEYIRENIGFAQYLFSAGNSTPDDR